MEAPPCPSAHVARRSALHRARGERRAAAVARSDGETGWAHGGVGGMVRWGAAGWGRHVI